ncbi:MAG: hypothetical protein GOV02_01455 [Candidatus Aenigmarchaeota archaeon]|nr:hypothetical protein [Candidatus Aenigmarchaeota archaeon]
MIVDVYKIFRNDEKIRVNICKEFKSLIRKKIDERYDSITFYSKKITNSSHVLYNYFRNDRLNASLYLLSKICKDLNINEEQLFSNIRYFSLQGGHIPIILPRIIDINENFMEGFAMFIGDGCVSKKSNIVFINSDKNLIKFFIKWLINHFKVDSSKIIVTIVTRPELDYTEYLNILKNANILENKINIIYDKNNIKKPCLKIYYPMVVFRKLFLNLKSIMKQKALRSDKLMRSYLRGIFSAEGSVRFNLPHKEVYIEMKDKNEIEFICKLLDEIGINYRKYNTSRKSRNFFKIYIAKINDLTKLSSMRIFGHNLKRQKILDNGVKEYLRMHE